MTVVHSIAITGGVHGVCRDDYVQFIVGCALANVCADQRIEMTNNNTLPLVLAFVAAAAFGLTVSMKTAAAAPPPHPPHSVRREALNTELLQLKRDADAEKAASAREDRQTRAVAEIPAEQVIVTEHPVRFDRCSSFHFNNEERKRNKRGGEWYGQSLLHPG